MPEPAPTPRQLAPADAGAYVALRREMLLDSPWAFLSSPGDDVASDTARTAAFLGECENEVFAVEDARRRLVAVAGVVRQKRPKVRHRALIWGVYTTPNARGQGLGEACVRAAVDEACTWPGVTVVFLSASDNSPGAIRLYERCGFEQWGVEPDCLRVDGASYDEVHLAMTLGA